MKSFIPSNYGLNYTITVLTGSLAKWVECSPIVLETWVHSQVASYQRLLKWYLIPLCLTFSMIRYVSRVKWNNSGKRVALSSTPRCSSYWKGSLQVALAYGRQLYLLFFNKDGFVYLSLPPTRHDLTHGQKPKGRLKWG